MKVSSDPNFLASLFKHVCSFLDLSCSYLEPPNLAAGWPLLDTKTMNAAKNKHIVEAQRNTPADVNTANRHGCSILVGDIRAQSCTSVRLTSHGFLQTQIWNHAAGKRLHGPWMNGNLAAPTGSVNSRPHGGAGICFVRSPQLVSNAGVWHLRDLQKWAVQVVRYLSTVSASALLCEVCF